MNIFLIYLTSAALGIYLIIVSVARVLKLDDFWKAYGPVEMTLVDPFKEGNFGWWYICIFSIVFILSMFLPHFGNWNVKLSAMMLANENLRSAPTLLPAGIISILAAQFARMMTPAEMGQQ